MKRLVFLIAAIMLLVGSGPLIAEDAGATYKVIVNSSNSVSSMSKEDVSKLFLKKTTTWKNDQTVYPVDLVSTSPVREKFSRDIHGKSTATIKNYWQQQIYSGRMTPPPEKESSVAVLVYVESNPGAIGYVSIETKLDDRKAKVLRITD